MTLPNVLVIDSDEGFGTMLKGGLESSGYYTVKWVDTGREGLRLVQSDNFDLVIIDIALTDMSPLKLALGIRHYRKDMRIMFIPFFGQDLPEKLKQLNPNGILSKPFFVGDLPDLVDEALGRTRTEPSVTAKVAPPVAPLAPGKVAQPSRPKESEVKASAESAVEIVTTVMVVSQETIRYLRANESEILRILDDLNREVRADAILLIAGLELIAQAGMLAREQCQELTRLVAQSSQAAAQAAKFLGEPDGRFLQSLHEGTEYRLYSLSLGEGILLSLALSLNVPLGMIRHQCRQAAEHLAQFII